MIAEQVGKLSNLRLHRPDGQLTLDISTQAINPIPVMQMDVLSYLPQIEAKVNLVLSIPESGHETAQQVCCDFSRSFSWF